MDVLQLLVNRDSTNSYTVNKYKLLDPASAVFLPFVNNYL